MGGHDMAPQHRWGPRHGPQTPPALVAPRQKPWRASITVAGDGGPDMAPKPPALAGPGKAVAVSNPAHSPVPTVRGLISTVRRIGVDGARPVTHGEREPDTCRP